MSNSKQYDWYTDERIPARARDFPRPEYIPTIEVLKANGTWARLPQWKRDLLEKNAPGRH